MDAKYAQLKAQLSHLCDIPSHLLCLAEVNQAQIKVWMVHICQSYELLFRAST